MQTLQRMFAERIGDAADRISYVMSGGTEGILSPHFTVISRSMDSAADAPEAARKALAVGVRHTRDFLPEEIGRMAQVEAVAQAVRSAMEEAGIERSEDVHCVQIKCPLLTTDAIHEAEERGARVVTEDTYKSRGYSRGASALGTAAALGEIDAAALSEADICSRWEKYSEV
ncbi:ring-opening amidohydrolase, partial [Bartonella sp. CL29QHWL]|uniref:ring-opening amidohydrolase n=1 Tax=Bartonella sp. CL29QHWL TaxID=3243522 RepID=UPI0035CFCD8E